MLALSDLKVGEEPEVGTVYMVPCLNISDTSLGNWTDQHFKEFKQHMVAIPIIGTPHKDPELPGAGGEGLHWHLDIRFVTQDEFDAWGISSDTVTPQGDFAFPVVGLSEAPLVPEKFLHPKMCLRQLPDCTKIKPGGLFTYSDFEDEMQDKTIKVDNPICPHHGMSLKSQCVRDGKVICPLHGLIWDINTGKLVRKTTSKKVLSGKVCYPESLF